MPGYDGQTILTYAMPTGGKLSIGLVDGDLSAAYDQLAAVVASCSEDRNDPTLGTWYCERLYR